MNSLKIKTKYQLSLRGGLVYYMLLALMLTAVLLHGNHSLWQSVPLVGKYALYDHVSNFVISFTVLSAVGLAMMLNKPLGKELGLAAGLVLLGNLLFEFGYGFGSIKDPWDALAGALGTLLGTAFLLLLQKRFISKSR